MSFRKLNNRQLRNLFQRKNRQRKARLRPNRRRPFRLIIPPSANGQGNTTSFGSTAAVIGAKPAKRLSRGNFPIWKSPTSDSNFMMSTNKAGRMFRGYRIFESGDGMAADGSYSMRVSPAQPMRFYRGSTMTLNSRTMASGTNAVRWLFRGAFGQSGSCWAGKFHG